MLKSKVINQRLRRIDGTVVSLRGLTTTNIMDCERYINKGTIKWFVDKWKINCIRFAVAAHGENGYIDASDEKKEQILEVLYRGVDACIELDIDVIVDWHTREDFNTVTDLNASNEFFNKVTDRYAFINNVIYEILNEPSTTTTWSDIRKYAGIIIPNIRINGDNIVIVGTPQKCKHIDYSASAPLNFDNILYSMHYYSATDKEEMRSLFHSGFDMGLPVVISQYGLCEDSFDGALNVEEASKWVRILKENKIGHIALSLSNIDKSSAIIKSSCTKLTDFDEEDYTENGKILFEYFSKYSNLF